MQGADEYYDLLRGQSQQIGRLYFQLHSHARGKCFEIFLLPEGLVAESTTQWRKNSVEVYGVTGGQRGWTETYGWLHKGKWQEDFAAIVDQKKEEITAINLSHKENTALRKAQETERIDELLSSYA